MGRTRPRERVVYTKIIRKEKYYREKAEETSIQEKESLLICRARINLR